MTSVVYFLRGEETGAIKIGTTKQLAARLAGIATSSSEALTLIGAVEGGAVFEKALHDEFAADRIRREWFKPTEALLARIADLIKDQEILPDGQPERDAPADDEYTKLAVKRLMRIEDNASVRLGCDLPTIRRDIAERLGISYGMIESFRYGRKTNPISARDYFAIEDAYLAELQTQLEELRQQHKIVKPCVAASANLRLAMATHFLGRAESERDSRKNRTRQLLSGEVK